MVANLEGPQEFSAQERVLRGVAHNVQLPKDWDDDARRMYREISDYLAKSEFGKYSPTIFPQGSQAIGTTNKPLGRDEFDLDAIVLTRKHSLTAEQLMDTLYSALESCPKIKSSLERRERCVRVNAPGRFHLDFVPARPSPLGGDFIEIPDFIDGNWRWKTTNPRGFKEWFLEQSEFQSGVAKMRQTEPVPARESAKRKSDLKITVQLIKQNQQLFLQSIGSDLNTPSIVITTLAGHIGASGSVPVTMGDVIDYLGAIASLPIPPDVRNPANQPEVVSEKWSDPEVFTTFQTWIRQLAQDWQTLQASQGTGIDQSVFVLRRMFGTDVTEKALSDLARSVSSASRRTALSASSAGTLAFTPSGKGAPKKTFYGIANDRRVAKAHSQRLPIIYKARLGRGWKLAGRGRHQVLSGSLRPTDLSRTYQVQIEFDSGWPTVRVLSPDLGVPQEQWAEAHMYGENRPCIFRPGKDDWTAGIKQTPSLVIWLSEWLFFYELRQSTGEWFGGGEHPPTRGAMNGN